MRDLTDALRPLDFAPFTEWATRGGIAYLGATDPDYIRNDGTMVLEVKDRTGGARDFRAGVVQLALQAHARPRARCVLVLLGTRMSANGVRTEWTALIGVLAPEIAARLGIVVVRDEDVVVIPDDPVLHRIAAHVVHVGRSTKRSRVDRSYEVLRILMARWLMKTGPLAIGELGRQAGLSHPSVSKALASLGDAVERKSNRSVVLRAVPREPWSQLVALAPVARKTHGFFDASGRGADPRRLLDRLARLRPTGVAVGGVVAARHWDPGLDLHGLPRLDVTVHAPDGHLDMGFVERLDPALAPASAGDPPLLVVHALPRAEPMFIDAPDGGVPLTDPVEAVLDLHELRLVAQADALIRHMRSPT